jgi:signal transduction histidine kinase
MNLGRETIHNEGFIERIYWLIKLRWIAIFGLILTIAFARQTLHLSLHFPPLYYVSALLCLYNLAFFLWLNRIREKGEINLAKMANWIANAQISLDLVCLITLIHFSGGIENPFIFYFIFHIIIASILLSRLASFLQASFSVLLFLLMVIFEYFGILPHYNLKELISNEQYLNPIYSFGSSFVFISTIYIAVYMATSISSKLREREKNLRQLNQLLEEKDRVKSEYVLRVTHDINQHLAAIQGCVELVETGFVGPLNEKQTDLLKRAKDRTGKLMAFVKALLKITHIKLIKKIEMEEFSIRKTIENAINFVDTKAKNKGISINCNIETVLDKLCGEQIYIEETITNILANAVKYTHNNGKVDISVKNDDNHILIQIADTGIGISEEDIPKVFDEFYRAKNAKALENDGTGLGLSIAKQVIERHNGRIWVESKIGVGSTFNIELPSMA